MRRCRRRDRRAVDDAHTRCRGSADAHRRPRRETGSRDRHDRAARGWTSAWRYSSHSRHWCRTKQGLESHRAAKPTGQGSVVADVVAERQRGGVRVVNVRAALPISHDRAVGLPGIEDRIKHVV